MTPFHDPLQNHLLAALPGAELQCLLPHLKPVAMPLGMVLYEPGSTQSHAYFPTTAIVSLLYIIESGASAEIAVIGCEGLVGVSLIMGGESTPSRAVVQSAGMGFRLKGQVIRDEMEHSSARPIMLRYTQALMTQISQTAVCNRHHSLDQQLCRWLLLSLDRLPSNKIRMTQELISNMLGVRRSGITEAARRLQAVGVIEYKRGHITIPDRALLEAHACECYAVVKKETDRLFG